MKKRITAFIIALMSLLSSCAPHLKSEMFDADGVIVDRRFEEALEAVKNQDKEAIKSMFSEKALVESKHFDEHMEYLFGFFQGNVLSWERAGGPGVFMSKTEGHAIKQASTWYRVNTDKQNYLFIFFECLKDTENPDNVGLYTLRVIRAEDKEKEFPSWNEIKIPGIYKPE